MTGPPASTDDDAEVVAQSLEEPEIFAGLYDRHAPDIHRYAARRLGEGAADDITAETFLIAFRSRHRYDGSHRSARPWLYGIAGHLIGKHRRSEERGLRALARTGQDPVAASWSDRSDDRIAAQAPWRRPSRRSRPATAMCCCSSPGPTSGTRRSPRRWASRSAPCGPGSTAPAARSARRSAWTPRSRPTPWS